MTRTALVAGAVAAALAGAAPAASADTLVSSAPGARNLDSGGGWLAWAAPAGAGRWKLTLRAPDGTLTTPAITDFRAAPDPSIGSDRFAFAGRRLLVVYSRCAGTSPLAGCDVYALDVGTGREERVATLATAAYSETAPSIESGRMAFVRRGAGPRPGVYAHTLGSSRPPRRLSRALARETATNASRVAYAFASSRGGGIAIRRLSGRGVALIPASRLRVVPRSVLLTRYNAAWLLAGGRVQSTARFAGSGGPFTLRVLDAARALPATTDSLGLRDGNATAPYYLDAEGVKAAEPVLF